MGRKRKCSAIDIYHVSSRGVNRKLIYEDDQDKQVFLGLLDRYLSRHGGRLLAWCLMGNHFHLLLQMPMGRLACLMHDLNVMYSKYFNKRHDCTGHLFGERYHSVPMQDEAQFVSTVCYIHHNPVAAAMSPPTLIAEVPSTPLKSMRPPAAFAPATRPCLLAQPASALRTFRPLTRFTLSTMSPAAKI